MEADALEAKNMIKLIPLLLLLSGCVHCPCEPYDSPLDPANESTHIDCHDARPDSGGVIDCIDHGGFP